MEKYKGLSAAQFFYRNREIAGFSNPVRAIYQTIRELVENALDATETFGILPEIKVEVNTDEEGRIKIRVEDNGIGIPGMEIPNTFGRVFYGSKYTLRQTRGVFGLGVKMAVLYAQITTGKPIRVISSTQRSHYIYNYQIQIDIEKNIPIILELKVSKKDNKWHGTIVELITQGNWQMARKRVEEYLIRTALITPYATISYKSPESQFEYRRVSDKLPPPPQVGKFHPRGVDIELLKMLIRRTKKDAKLLDFLCTHFDGVGRITAYKFCEWAGFDPEKPVKQLSVGDLEKLAKAMKEFPKWRRPRPITLSPLGEKLLKEGVKHILNPEFVAAVTRPPSSFGANPFIVEVAVAYGGDIPVSQNVILYRFANRIPLLYDEGADVARKIVDSIDWGIYKIKFPAPLAVVTHVCSTKLPFKGVGKEAIADVPEIERELTIAIREAARKLRLYLSKVEQMMELKKRRVVIGRYIDEVARALAYITGTDESYLSRKLRELLESDIKRRAALRGEVSVASAK